MLILVCHTISFQFVGLIGLGITVFLTVWTIVAAVKKWDHIENEDDAADTD